MSEANGGATEANGVSNGRDPSWRRVSEGSQGFFPELKVPEGHRGSQGFTPELKVHEVHGVFRGLPLNEGRGAKRRAVFYKSRSDLLG